jgi:hypothetical protein
MIFDLRFEEKDDDGNAAGGISNEKGADWTAAIEGAGDPAETMKVWQNAIAEAEKACDGKPDYKAMKFFTDARDKRLKQFKRGSNG